MNTDLSVPDLVSKVKGVFVISFLLCDIIFAVFQLLPFMGTIPFIFLYFILYILTTFLYFVVSYRDPGYNEKKSGHHMLSLLEKEYESINMTNYSNSKIKKVATKLCFNCNIVKSKLVILFCVNPYRTIKTLRNL
jgi:hypothetical protein